MQCTFDLADAAPLGEPTLKIRLPAPLVVFYLPHTQHIYRAFPFRHLETSQMAVAKSHSPGIVYSTEAILKLKNSKLSPKQPTELTSFPVSNIKGTNLSSSKATTNGPRIVYFRAFLLQLNRYPLSKKVPKDLEYFPSDIVEEINYVFSEETKEGPSFVYSTEALLKLRNSKLSQKQPTELRSFPIFIIKGTNFSPSKATTNGPRIVYHRAFLLQLNRYPLPKKAPKDLESFPSDIIEEINYMFSEDTKEGQRFLYTREFLLQLNNTPLSQKPPKDITSFLSDIILRRATNKPDGAAVVASSATAHVEFTAPTVVDWEVCSVRGRRHKTTRGTADVASPVRLTNKFGALSELDDVPKSDGVACPEAHKFSLTPPCQ